MSRVLNFASKPATPRRTATIPLPFWASPNDRLKIVEVRDDTFQAIRFVIVHLGMTVNNHYHTLSYDEGYFVRLLRFNQGGTVEIVGSQRRFYAPGEVEIEGCVRDLCPEDPELYPNASRWTFAPPQYGESLTSHPLLVLRK